MVRLVSFLIFCFSFASADCPENQSTYSMVYPAKVVFVSEADKSKTPEKVPAIIIKAILEQFKVDSPRIVFIGSEKTFLKVKKSILSSFDDTLLNKKLSLYETQPA